MKHRLPASALLICLGSGATRAEPVEVAVRGELTLVSDDAVKGGGLGPGVELRVPVVRDFLLDESSLILGAGASALFLSGVVWTFEAGAAWRLRLGARWRPDVGLSVLVAGGDLVRTIDSEGRIAGSPVALRLGLAPLRFQLRSGSVSFLAIRFGPTLGPLGDGGTPPFAASLEVLEVALPL